MKTKTKHLTVSFDRFLTLESKAKRFEARIAELEKRLDRLTDHVNREIGVAEETPFHMRVGA